MNISVELFSVSQDGQPGKKAVRVSLSDLLENGECPLGIPDGAKFQDLKERGVLRHTELNGEKFYTADVPVKVYMILNQYIIVGVLIFEQKKRRFALFRPLPEDKDTLLVTQNVELIKQKIREIYNSVRKEEPSANLFRFLAAEKIHYPEDRSLLVKSVIQFSSVFPGTANIAENSAKYKHLRKKLEKKIKEPLIVLNTDKLMVSFYKKDVSEKEAVCAWMHTAGESLLDLALPPLKERISISSEDKYKTERFVAGRFFNIYEDWQVK